jgi:hypothetical protein
MDTNAAVAAILPERYFITPPPDEFTATIGEFRLDAKSVPHEKCPAKKRRPYFYLR